MTAQELIENYQNLITHEPSEGTYFLNLIKVKDALDKILSYEPPPVVQGNCPTESGWYFVKNKGCDIMINYYHYTEKKWQYQVGDITAFKKIEMETF